MTGIEIPFLLFIALGCLASLFILFLLTMNKKIIVSSRANYQCKIPSCGGMRVDKSKLYFSKNDVLFVTEIVKCNECRSVTAVITKQVA